MPSQIHFNVYLHTYDSESELTPQQLALLQAARQATHTAYAPYSLFFVGAAILLEDGTVIKGSNQENAAYPSGLCAERTAIYAAGANFPQSQIQMIAVTARKHNTSVFLPANPCGACRQAMLEYENKQEKPIQILLEAGDGKFYLSESVGMLLPLQFNRKHL